MIITRPLPAPLSHPPRIECGPISFVCTGPLEPNTPYLVDAGENYT